MFTPYDSDLMAMARIGNAGMVRGLLAGGANVNAKNVDDMTALHMAATHGHWATVAELLAAPGINVDARSTSGRTPLMCATQSCDERTIRQLLAAKADTNAADRDGWTALHMAASRGRDDTVQLLLSAGADFMKTDQQGRTPAKVAKEKSPAAGLLADLEKKFFSQKQLEKDQITAAKRIEQLDRLARGRKKRSP